MKHSFRHRAIDLALIAAIAGAAGIATAGETLLGLPFGEKLDRDIPECRSVKTFDDYCGRYNPYPRGKSGPYFLRRPDPNSPLTIPNWIVPNEPVMVTTDADGNIVQIDVITTGPSGQPRIIEAITERFGAPTERETVNAKTLSGLAFQYDQITWDTPAVHVRHSCRKVDACNVAFMTRKGLELFDAKAKEFKAKGKL